MAIWMTFLCLMTWVLFRDGPPKGYSWPTMWAILMLFWIFGGAVSVWASTIRVVRVEVTDSGAIEVTWRSPFWAERRRVEAADVPGQRWSTAPTATATPTSPAVSRFPMAPPSISAESHDEASIEAADRAVQRHRRPPPWSLAAKAGMITA